MSINPPLQPLFPYDPEQSTSCCSEYELNFWVAINLAPYNDPVVENAQHDPHWPWFLIGVTAPFEVQSTYSGKLFVEACFPVHLLVTFKLWL
jgi:hypothetical protein